MLLNLHVKNLAIIDEVDVYFTDHLNILTGETGAGKSIIIGSINIALGGKVNKDIIRKGADYALVELVFQIDDLHTIQKLKELDIEMEDNQLIVSRKIMNGRVVNKINGNIVPTATLRSVASFVIDIHGQHEHQSLLYKTKHLSILDRFAKNEILELKAEIRKYYQQYNNIKRELDSDDMTTDQRLRQMSFLEYEINEIENARLKKGEEEELFAQFKKMSNASEISENINGVYQLTSQSQDSVSENLSRSLRMLAKVDELDESLAGFKDQLIEIESLMNDFNRDLSSYQDEMQFDPSAYQEVDERLNLIHNLKAKYGNSFDEIQEYYAQAKAKLEKYQDYDCYVAKLNKEKERLEEILEEECSKLSEIRQKYALELKNKIVDALLDLNFLDVRFEVNFNRFDHFTENGFDDVEFLIATNIGEDLKPLAKVASGGELSRVMLALKSVLADNDAIDTLIFDEIDVGVSGRTAQKVSERLSFIAKDHQVLCITHLPQIAAMADSHYIIEKSATSDRTSTTIYRLDEEKSVSELARILGGAVITDAVIHNAKEMKELAAKTKLYSFEN
ncbi:DNA repair protein RecN [Lachnospiraceae bacterium KM106-2]|nr:DNA repair protein RecN [Lachnospiraceae bacterium KM106-2]